MSGLLCDDEISQSKDLNLDACIGECWNVCGGRHRRLVSMCQQIFEIVAEDRTLLFFSLVSHKCIGKSCSVKYKVGGV